MSLRRLADDDRPESVSNRLRSRRFRLFEELARALPRPLTVLDVGGVNEFWEQRGWAGREDIQITLLNLAAEPRKHANIHPVAGDATNLAGYADGSFDVAFSNSVIEHLFTRDAQAAMAREVRRVGRAYWVQTPNFWFPMEPHFLLPGWQWLPVRARVEIIRRRTCGWRGPCPDRTTAERTVREVRLMRRGELARLFPGGTIVPERIARVTKSFIVHGGFPA